MAKRKKMADCTAAQPSAHTLCQSIMQSVADGVLAIDLDQNITAFNRAAEAITGVPRDEAIGRKCYDVLRASSCDDRCSVRQAMASGTVAANRRITILDVGGNEIPIDISAAPLRDDAGNIVGGVETFRDLSSVEKLRRQLTESYTYRDIIGKSAPMRRLFKILPAIAESESTVLIEGESGTGKELFARAIHDLSPRGKEPYVIVNCGALPETLVESELFGYRKGAFTDARKDKPGRFELAEGGSIFLDEIEALAPAVQVKLLRVIETQVFEPLGATGSIQANVRIIAATNRPLRGLVQDGKFRDDLFYRLNVVTLELPPLRARRDDIPLLVDHFVEQFNVSKGRGIAGVSAGVMQAITVYEFPGNVRELQNVIEHAFVLCASGLIDVQHLPPFVFGDAAEMEARDTEEDVQPIARRRPLDMAEADTIRAALARNDGHRERTASDLGVSASTLWRKMQRYDISFGRRGTNPTR